MKSPKASARIKETVVLDLLEAYDRLPQNWRVIYHEAFRGNHLLFDQKDLDLFSSKLSHKKLAVADRKHALRAASKMVSSPDLSGMKMHVNGLGIESKYFLFRLYLRYVAGLREQIQKSLN